jgi:hypothetical protein
LSSTVKRAKQGSPITDAEEKWLNDHTVGTVGGGATGKAKGYPDYVQKEINDYEKTYAKHNLSYGLIATAMHTWALAKHLGGGLTMVGEGLVDKISPTTEYEPYKYDNFLQEKRRIGWALEVGRDTAKAQMLREKAKQAEAAAKKYEE